MENKLINELLQAKYIVRRTYLETTAMHTGHLVLSSQHWGGL